MFDSDKHLLSELQAGKEYAFKQLFDRHGDSMFNLAFSICGNKPDAEDIIQESFAEIFKSVGNFRGESSLSTWIYRITLNKALEAERRKKRKKRAAQLVSLFGFKDKEEYHSVTWEHPGIITENKELAEILFKAIQKLPENQRVAFTLHKTEGMEYKEIAELMNVSLSSVESLIHRAKTNLKKLLNEYYTNR